MSAKESIKLPKEDKKSIKISVRSLVEFVLKSGDIDNRITSDAQKDAMLEGGRIHRKLQKLMMGPSYRSEVVLKYLVDERDFQILVEGRADGIIEDEDGVTIDEIKGVFTDISRLEEPVPVHLAQARCYGFMYMEDHDTDRITIQVTYCQMETEQLRRFRYEYTRDELGLWFDGLIREYVKWADHLYRHELRRDASLKKLEFPYEYRTGQKELATSVYRAIARGRNLFIQAPTGVGKTLSTIYPGLKAMGEGIVEKLFYLTAKTITRSVAEETFVILEDNGMYLTSVTITAKEKMCILDTPSCNPDDCPYAKGHFDRVNEAVFTIIQNESRITRDKILEYSDRFSVCPFEFSLDISGWADAVICDYNYVFDPNVRLKRYFSEEISGDYLFLIDEAHNLVSRGREMYSASLIKEDVLSAKRLLKGHARLTKYFDRVNKILLEMKRESAEPVILDSVGNLVMAAQSLYGVLERFLDEERGFQDRDDVMDFFFELRDFLMIYEEMDEGYRIYSELLPDGRFMVKLFCVNPAGHLRECLSMAKSSILFSATLLPMSYYKELLGGDPDDYAVYAQSPFPEENRLLLIADDVSSRYTRRTRTEFAKVADYIELAARSHEGNYMVFFPSYQYMEEVEQLWKEKMDCSDGPIRYIIQKSRMNEDEREGFLREFDEDREGSLVAFCVMGGVFAESIDLKEDRLIGAVIVGTGLPMVCTEQEILKDYFEEEKGKGFDYAYRFPGMNKVLQAAGRVIRTMDDKGVILLLDDRFLRSEYDPLFPREWNRRQSVNLKTAERAMKEFWDG